jgi:hypothetical protein
MTEKKTKCRLQLGALIRNPSFQQPETEMKRNIATVHFLKVSVVLSCLKTRKMVISSNILNRGRIKHFYLSTEATFLE